MKRFIIGIAITGMTFLMGCASTGYWSRTGAAAIMLQKEAVVATQGTGSRKGEACSMNILGIFSGGDSSVDAAKRAGGINTVATVDTAYTNILAIYGSVCTVVTGS